MKTYTQIIYQIVFTTKNRERTLTKENRHLLFRYITGILKNKNCHLYQINGVEDHMHIITSLHPHISLASLVKDIKIASSQFIKSQKIFPFFTGWQDGYAAFTYSNDAKTSLIAYVKNQEEHHKTKTFSEELAALLTAQGIEPEQTPE